MLSSSYALCVQWVFEVEATEYNAATHQTTFNFSLAKGGNQGSRGGNAGQVRIN